MPKPSRCSRMKCDKLFNIHIAFISIHWISISLYINLIAYYHFFILHCLSIGVSIFENKSFRAFILIIKIFCLAFHEHWHYFSSISGRIFVYGEARLKSFDEFENISIHYLPEYVVSNIFGSLYHLVSFRAWEYGFNAIFLTLWLLLTL